jgi:hypothetical protein
VLSSLAEHVAVAPTRMGQISRRILLERLGFDVGEALKACRLRRRVGCGLRQLISPPSAALQRGLARGARCKQRHDDPVECQAEAPSLTSYSELLPDYD